MSVYDIILPQAYIDPLTSIDSAVKALLKESKYPLDISPVLNICDSIRMNSGNRYFPYVYAGILLAKVARNSSEMQEAIGLLERDQSENSFSRLVAQHLRKYGDLEPRTTVFSNANPYEAWNKTGLFQNNLDGVTDRVMAFAKINPPTIKAPTILEIGPGSGALIVHLVNKLIELHDLKAINIILVDPFSAMLQKTKGFCQQHISIPQNITLVENRMQDIVANQSCIHQIKQCGPIWFSHASLSLHHMPRDEKISTLEMLSQIAPYCLITEYEANHDLPAPNSPELFYSMVGSYGYAINDVLISPATEEEKMACLEGFLLAEALVMLRSEQKKGDAKNKGRIDFHTTMEQWIDIARIAGFKIKKAEPVVEIPNVRPFTYFLELEA